MYKVTITVHDIGDKGPELWSKVSKSVPSMVDGFPDGTAILKYFGELDDGCEIVAVCLGYGDCDVEIHKVN